MTPKSFGSTPTTIVAIAILTSLIAGAVALTKEMPFVFMSLEPRWTAEHGMTAASLTAGGMDCGPKALYASLRARGVRVDYAQLRRAARTDQSGTTIDGLIAGAAFAGIRSRGWYLTYDDLCRTPMPVIVHLTTQHYVAIYGCSADALSVFDPTVGDLVMSRRALEQTWSGNTLVFDWPSGGRNQEKKKGI